MTQKDNEISERKNYSKPGLINYGDLSTLTMTNVSDTGQKDGGNPKTLRTGPTIPDGVDQTFERFDGSSDYSRRGGSGGDGGGRGG